MSKVKELRTRVEQLRGERAKIQGQLKETKREIRELRSQLRNHERAREVVREVGLKTQQQLQYHVSNITSLALEAVFSDPYELVVEFVERRNKTECDLWFQRDGERVKPLLAAGGGAVDVASFALRVACWSMYRPRSRNVLVLDEPFRYLSTDLLPKAAEMLKQISDKLGLQILMITHSEELAQEADRMYRISYCQGVSSVDEA